MKILLYFICTLILIGCKVSVSKYNNYKIQGIYQSEESLKRIEFIENGNFLIIPYTGDYSYEPNYPYQDTLSFGNWSIKKDLIILNSSIKLDYAFLEVEVTEAYETSKDNNYVSFIIENKNLGYTTVDKILPLIYYQIHVKFNDGVETTTDLFSKEFVINKRNRTINEFSIKCFPNVEVYPYNITVNKTNSVNYKLVGNEANLFRIKFKDFNPNYFSYVRLNGDYIKILNNDSLVWNNELFIKVDKEK